MATYDIVITGGTVVDGTGAAPAGPTSPSTATGSPRSARWTAAPPHDRRRGRLVTPGFVDIHTHLDAQLAWDPLGRRRAGTASPRS